MDLCDFEVSRNRYLDNNQLALATKSVDKATEVGKTELIQGVDTGTAA